MEYEEPEIKLVPVKRILIAGIILGIFHPPVIGIVYFLCFIWAKETRKTAIIVLVWTLAWTLLYGTFLGWYAAYMLNV